MPAAGQSPDQAADQRVVALLDEDLEATMRRHPTWASQRGDRRFDDQLGDPSPAAAKAEVEEARARLARLEAIDVAPATAGVGAGSGLSTCVPLPNWPTLLLPQHIRVPPATIAQLCPAPAATAVAPVTPATATGDGRLVIDPSPICPTSLAPQQRTVPSPNTAQVW